MIEPETEGMQRLAPEGDRTKRIRTVDIALLADQGMAAKARLDPDLVTTPGLKPHLDERCIAKTFDHVILADRFHALRIAWVGFLLDERLGIPDQRVAPGAGGWRRAAIDDRAVNALRFTPGELGLQPPLRLGILSEDHQAGGVLVDAMDDERAPF